LRNIKTATQYIAIGAGKIKGFYKIFLLKTAGSEWSLIPQAF